jgi:hypothetical protein
VVIALTFNFSAGRMATGDCFGISGSLLELMRLAADVYRLLDYSTHCGDRL